MTPPDGFKKTSWSDTSGSPKSIPATGIQTVPGWRSKAPTTGGDQHLNQRLERLDSVTESPSLGSINSSSCSSLGSLWEPDYGRRLERYRSFGSVPRIASASGQAGQLSTSRSCGALARAHRTRKPHLDSSSEIDWRMSEISLLPDDNFLESDISLVRLEPDSLNISLCSNPQEQPRSSSVASVRSTPLLPAPDSVVTDERLRSKDIGEGTDHHHSASNHGLQRSPKRRQIGYSKDSLEALAVHVPRDPDTPRTLSLDSVTLDECLVLLRHDEAQESLERPGGHSVRRCCSESSAKQGMARRLRPSLSDDDDPTLSSGSPLSLSSRTTCTQTDSGHEMVVYSRSCPPEPSPQSLLWELLDLMKILARGPAFQQEHRCRCCCNHNGRQSADVQSKCSVNVCKRPVNEFDRRGTSPKGNRTASLSDHASIQRSEARKNCVLSSDRTGLVRLTEKARSAKRLADESLDSGILMDSSSVSGSSSPERWLSSNAEIPSKTRYASRANDHPASFYPKAKPLFSIVRENSGDSGIASDSSRSPSAVTKRPGTLPRQGSKPGAHDWTLRTTPRPDQRVPLPHRPVHQSGAPRVRGSGDLFPADSFRTLPLISLYGTSWGSRVPQGYVYGLPASTAWNYGTTMAQFRRPS